VGDLNGDGKLDLAVLANSDSVSVLLGNGDGTFQASVNYALAGGAQPYAVAFGDFNGDGRMDMVVANWGLASVSVFVQQGPAESGNAQLVGGNVFSGAQTVNGTVTATSFVGNGSGLTGVNAAHATSADTANFATSAGAATTAATANNALSLGGVSATNYARLDTGTVPDARLSSNVALRNGGNAFNGTQNIVGTTQGLVASGSTYGVQGQSNNVGVYGTGLYGVLGSSSSLTGYGVFGEGFNVGVFGGAVSTGTAAMFNVLGTGPILVGQNNGTTKFLVANNGNMTASGSVAIGNGSPITSHASLYPVPFTVSVKSGGCTTMPPISVANTADADSVVVALPTALMNASSSLFYSAWASSGAVTVRLCILSGPGVTNVSGNLRIDLWKH
jgi:hypothetical protein